MNCYNVENAIIEISNDCNLRCRHCYGIFEKRKFMPINYFLNIVKQLYEAGCSSLVISGGEPTLLKDELWDYVNAARNIGIRYIALTTNGTIPFDSYENFKLFDMVQVSLDGEETVHDNIRGAGNFRRAIVFIKCLQDQCVNVSVMMSIYKDNVQSLPWLYDFCAEHHIEFGIEIVTPCGRGEELPQIDVNQYKYLKSFIKLKNIQCNDPIAFINQHNTYYSKNILGGCMAGINSLCIDTEGNVYPCPRLRVFCGNLQNQSLKFIWEYNEILIKLRNRDLYTGKCKKCKFLYSCGGCRARAFVTNQNFCDEDSLCLMYEER